MPPITAARSVFTRLTLRLEDRPIAASANTSVLPKAGKPYALRFHRSIKLNGSLQHAAQHSASQRSTLQRRAYAHRPRSNPWPAYTLYRHVPAPHLTTLASHIASPTYDAGRPALTRLSAAIVALQLGRRTSCTSDRPAWRTWVAAGGRPGIASHARLCAGEPDYRWKELDAGQSILR